MKPANRTGFEPAAPRSIAVWTRAPEGIFQMAGLHPALSTFVHSVTASHATI